MTWLRRNGYIVPGAVVSGNLFWSRSWGRSAGSVGYRCEMTDRTRPRFRVKYTVSRDGGEVMKRDYGIDLESTSCNFGGSRWWFRCPLTKGTRYCGRRCGVLYMPPGASYFGCRLCHDLTYTSCKESRKWQGLFASIGRLTGMSPRDVERALADDLI
jgi:hypothetical protein